MSRPFCVIISIYFSLKNYRADDKIILLFENQIKFFMQKKNEAGYRILRKCFKLNTLKFNQICLLVFFH
jgi:hypothetical protein